MKFRLTSSDLLLVLVWYIIYIAYLGGFGESGWLFYLHHTPPVLFILPPIFYCIFQMYKRRIPVVPLAFTALLLLNLFVFMGRTIIFSNKVPPSDNLIRVCSWNSAYFFKWGRDVGLSTLKGQNCDVILLQEVWKSELMTNEIASIRNEYFPTMDFYSQGEFLVLAPKGSVVEVNRSNSKGHFSVTLQNKNLTLTSIHLWNPITDMPTLDTNGKVVVIPAIEARESQKKELLTFLARKTDVPHLIVGDFNTLQNGKIQRDITKISPQGAFSYLSTPIFSNKNTYPANFPFLHIDYAFTSKSLQQSGIAKKCLPQASDHCLLIIDLML